MKDSDNYFMKDYQDEKREDDLQVISVVEKQVKGVLSEVQYIAELLGTQKKFKSQGVEIENINAKIRAAIARIKAYLEPNQSAELIAQIGNRRAAGIEVEQNPLIKEMGGMPLENISVDWQEALDSKLQDKAELENMVNKKLRNRVELANKLKAKNRLTNKPTSKPGQQLTPKYQKIKETMKLILKEMPEPPKPAPVPRFEPPRPPGM